MKYKGRRKIQKFLVDINIFYFFIDWMERSCLVDILRYKKLKTHLLLMEQLNIEI